MSQRSANEREQEDAKTQRTVIVPDSDGAWLIRELKALANANHVIRSPADRRFSFLGEDDEALLSRLEACESGVTIRMPSGCVIRRIEGHDLDTWIFRVDNGYAGSDGEYFDLAFRRIDSGDHLLYLRYHKPQGASSR